MFDLFHFNHHVEARNAERRADRRATSDRVVLADGSVVVVPRANLIAAKALIAAQKVAERKVEEQRREEEEREAERQSMLPIAS